MPLSLDRSAFDQDWKYQSAVYDLLVAKVKRLTSNEWNTDGAAKVLLPVEFDMLLVLMFVNLWENYGSFVYSVRWFEDQYEHLDTAFRRLGFNVASVLLPRALELYALQSPYHANDLPLPEDVESETQRVNEAASSDVSDDRLTAAISDQAALFDL